MGKEFYPIISLFPDAIQKAIVSEFEKNISSNKDSCCDSSSLIQSIGKELNNFEKEFAENITKKVRKSKRGFACFRSNEVVARSQGLPLQRSFMKENREFTRTMLKSRNKVSRSLLACMNQIKKISLRNVGLFCSKTELKDKLFNKNSNKEYTSIKFFPDDEIETFNQCFEYMKNMDSFSNTILGSYLDSLNTLIGTDKCNYLSNLFSMDPIKDKDDPLLPKDLKELSKNASEKDASKTTNSPKLLLDKWQKCARSKTEFDTKKIEEMADDIRKANYVNPNGLSTYIGRADIKYGIFKEKFNLVDYPYYQVECKIKGCRASFKGRLFSDHIYTALNGIVKGEKTKFKISCCDNVCVIYVEIEENGKDLEAAEIFEMKGDKNTLDISKLDLNELKNSEKCLNKPINIIEEEEKTTKFIEVEQAPTKPAAKQETKNEKTATKEETKTDKPAAKEETKTDKTAKKEEAKTDKPAAKKKKKKKKKKPPKKKKKKKKKKKS